MDAIQIKFFATGLFLLFIFLSGLWVSRSGKPYNVFIFNIHKFIGLGMGAFLITTVYRFNQAVPLSPIETTSIVITVLLFLITVAAGGLLSVEKEMPLLVSLVHKFSPYLIVLSTAATLYLLLYRE